MQNKGGIVPEPPEKLYTTPGSESGRPNNDGRPPALSGQSRVQTAHFMKHESNGVSDLLFFGYPQLKNINIAYLKYDLFYGDK